MNLTRLAKAVMTACLALYAFIVVFDNLTDYDSNFEFVRHVLSMDTTFPGNALKYRAIEAPWAWQAAYLVIILGEALTGIALAIGAIQLFQRLRGPVRRFEQAKRFVVLGVGLGFLVWFLGFMVIGGEWFAMWQSKVWNGQQAAFRLYITQLAVLIFVIQRDRRAVS